MESIADRPSNRPATAPPSADTAGATIASTDPTEDGFQTDPTPLDEMEGAIAVAHEPCSVKLIDTEQMASADSATIEDSTNAATAVVFRPNPVQWIDGGTVVVLVAEVEILAEMHDADRSVFSAGMVVESATAVT